MNDQFPSRRMFWVLADDGINRVAVEREGLETLRVTVGQTYYHQNVTLRGDAAGRFLDGAAAMRTPRDAACVLVCRDGRFAAIRSRKNNGQVEIPGGKINMSETPEQAAVREAREETGLECSDLVEIYTGIVNGWMAHVFLADAAGELRSSDEGEAFWATPEEILGGTYAQHSAVFMPVALRVLRATGKMR